jgi:hypothetical protein
MGKFRAGLAGAESKVRQILEEAEREEAEGGATSVQPMFQPKKRPTIYRPLSHGADDEGADASDTEEEPPTRRPALATDQVGKRPPTAQAVRRPPTGQIPAVKKSVVDAVAEDAKTAEDPVEPAPRPRQASQARPAVSRGAPVSSATAPPPKRKG